MLKRYLILLLILPVIVVAGCGKKTTNDYLNEIEANATESVSLESTSDEVEEAELSPLTGKALDMDQTLPRPIAVMIDNLSAARPQSAIKDADLVYEIMAEGMITRYMAVYYGTTPEVFGPIRSARPYFIDRAREFDAVYIHVGGSPDALSYIKKNNIPDIEGLVSSSMYRDKTKGKKAPHNMYAKETSIMKEMIAKKYVTSVDEEWSFDQEFFKFSKEAEVPYRVDDVNVFNVTDFQIDYRKNYGGGKYLVSYAYNSEENNYTRSINNKEHKDEIDGTIIKPSNIIVQFAGYKVLDDKGRLEMYTTGTGKGILFSGGLEIPITWEKNASSSVTEFFDMNSEPITLTPGQTFIQVVPNEKSIVLGVQNE